MRYRLKMFVDGNGSNVWRLQSRCWWWFWKNETYFDSPWSYCYYESLGERQQGWQPVNIPQRPKPSLELSKRINCIPSARVAKQTARRGQGGEMGKKVWHWFNRDPMFKASKAHCGRMWPDNVTGTPKEVTCKDCIIRGFDYGGRDKSGEIPA
jgi:hypothetical protein